jgi:peptidoglycan/xylan/chitin deacetylase (PgdA/CDA1 family)
MTTTVCLTFDFDAFSIWMSTFKQTTPTALSRGEYSGRVGVVRVLEMLGRHNVPATFFVPAHTASTYPEIVGALVGAGHEVASHGYLHESPVGLDAHEEEQLLLRSRDVLETVAGVRPVGYRSPAWDLSDQSVELLLKHDYRYDSSMMADDFRPYFVRCGDRLGDDGYVFGEERELVEFPVAWELDDFPYFHHSVKLKLPSLRRAADVYDIWADEFDYCDQKVPDGVFNLTCHPEVIGRGPRIEMLGRLIAHMRSSGATFSTLAVAADRFAGTS